MLLRLLAFIVITASLVGGLVSALTAYVPTLDAVEADLEADSGLELHLNAPAGRTDAGEPIGRPGDALTAELVGRLREAGVERVRLREFALGRWRTGLLFVPSALGLAAGAYLGRLGRRRRLEGAGVATAGPESSPERALEEAKALVDQLRAELPAMASDADRLHAILERVGDIQRTQFMTIADAQAELTGAFGMSNYARFMDRFAAAERIVNRAWSAAADGELTESMWCLDVAAERLDEAIERLPSERARPGDGLGPLVPPEDPGIRIAPDLQPDPIDFEGELKG